MSKRAFEQLATVLANLLWLIACLPGWIRFTAGLRRPRSTQWGVLRRILRANRATQAGRLHGFAAMDTPENFQHVPIRDYTALEDAIAQISRGERGVLTTEPVTLLQPTSGSTAGSKLIPYTRGLQHQFRAAIDPWIASLYFAYPRLLLRRQYWSISPSTRAVAPRSEGVPIGFADDTAYLGGFQRWLAGTLLCTPAELGRVQDVELHSYLTLLFLCRERNLGLISIWHPSFLTLLLETLPDLLPRLIEDIEQGGCELAPQEAQSALDPPLRDRIIRILPARQARAAELRACDLSEASWPREMWPRLHLISCWTDGQSEPWLGQLRNYFPGVQFQGKGLTATEGIVTIPWGRNGRHVLASASHYFEFVEEDGEHLRAAWELKQGQCYAVVLTTAGGLIRYPLHDRVRVTGFAGQTPCLAFLGRDNCVSDLVGEKLHEGHVADCLAFTRLAVGAEFQFAMLAPTIEQGRASYVLFAEPRVGGDPDWQQLARTLDERLRDNFHYAHARRLGQLGPLRAYRIAAPAARTWKAWRQQQGIRAGDVKFPALWRETCMPSVFPGTFVA